MALGVGSRNDKDAAILWVIAQSSLLFGGLVDGVRLMNANRARHASSGNSVLGY